MKKWFALVAISVVVLPISARQFPLCLYSVNNPSDLKTIQQAGFTCIQSYNTDPKNLEKLAKEAQKQGLQVVFYPNKLLGTQYEKKAQKWPVLAWYLVDEPDVHKMSRERVTELYKAAKKAFPQHDTALVIGQGRTYPKFYDIPDIMMVDWYPVPHYPMETFGDQVSYMREEMGQAGVAQHPAWGVVQAFDWKGFEQFRPDNDRIGRFPTADEMRFMSYDGIINGANGLFYFTFNHQGKPLPESAPEYWQRLANVVQELNEFKTIMEQGTPVENPVRVREPLAMKSWQYEGHIYSVLLNRDDRARKVPSRLRTDTYTPLYNTQKDNKIPAYGVWILKK